MYLYVPMEDGYRNAHEYRSDCRGKEDEQVDDLSLRSFVWVLHGQYQNDETNGSWNCIEWNESIFEYIHQFIWCNFSWL